MDTPTIPFHFVSNHQSFDAALILRGLWQPVNPPVKSPREVGAHGSARQVAQLLEDREGRVALQGARRFIDTVRQGEASA